MSEKIIFSTSFSSVDGFLSMKYPSFKYLYNNVLEAINIVSTAKIGMFLFIFTTSPISLSQYIHILSNHPMALLFHGLFL